MVASAANAVDVDYLARPREAEVEHGHETLAAGQGPGLVAVAGQEAQRLRDRQRIVIPEPRRLHRGEPSLHRAARAI